MSRRGGGIIAVVVVIALVLLGTVAVNLASRDTVTFTVRDKATKLDCDSDHKCKDKYLVYTDHGTYEDTDTVLFFKFDSSDLYGSLERGKRYTCKVVGVRLPLFSSYRNLLACDPA